MYRTVMLFLCCAAPVTADEPKPVRIVLHPSPASRSALQHRLLPELRDMQTGNAAVHYFRAFAPELTVQYMKPDALKKIDELTDKPLSELKGREAGVSAPSLAALRDGAFATTVDWEMAGRARRDGMQLLIPELSGVRDLARQLTGRTRVRIANGRFAEAHDDIRTGFALARHVADGPTLINGLVGVSLASTTLSRVEEWIGQPAAPNLYWPLTDLPTPLIDLRRAVEGERLLLDSAFPGWRDARPGEYRVDREKVMAFFGGVTKSDGAPIPGNWSFAAITALGLPAGKAHLKSLGWTDAQIDATPAVTVVALHQAAEFDRIAEEFITSFGLPPAEALARIEKVSRQANSGGPMPGGRSLASLLMPAYGQVYQARVRLDRRVAALRVIEAVRSHLTATGDLPDSLAAITATPVPNDPATSRPFEYRKSGAEARLILGPIPGAKAILPAEYVLTKP